MGVLTPFFLLNKSKRNLIKMSKRFTRSTKVQSVIVKRRKGLTERKARTMIENAGFDFMKIDVTPHTYRFRQESPSLFKPKTFRTIHLKPGLNAVIGVPR